MLEFRDCQLLRGLTALKMFRRWTCGRIITESKRGLNRELLNLWRLTHVASAGSPARGYIKTPDLTVLSELQATN